MVKPEFIHEPKAHYSKQSDQGLDDQSFFDAQKPTEINQRTIPTDFIIQRMMREE